MNSPLPIPPKEAILYEDKKLYACLATYPLAKGHTVLVWKADVPDLGKLSSKDYDYLMDAVNKVRNALIKSLKIKKVYLLYMDEAQHVHWHLIPRYNEKGFDVLTHKPKKTTDFSLAEKIKKNI